MGIPLLAAGAVCAIAVINSAYMPTTAETRTVAELRNDLIDSCMKDEGFAQWTPAPDFPGIGGKILPDWRYGIYDAALSAKNRYHPALAEQRVNDAAMVEGAVDESGADDGQVRQCAQQASGDIPTVQTADLVAEIDGDTYRAAVEDPAVVAALTRWSSCMKDEGDSYAKPMEANDDPQFSAPSTISAGEITTATADVACRDAHKVERTWFDTEVVLPDAAIKKNRVALDKIKNTTETSIAQAKSYAARQ
ncbi:hypothetical protein QFZ24_010058 [Streptomyces phaeochromogenes]|uniref:hypothetical protein n=1 Tax=Streptomyces phaeochromogenes TaxID=1923 RepID=UPI00278E019B|nr:hypothetical protein [Streptomyces phaeochromogenes]MDQ0956049.1 hypothetical protein [Streptomyces phaeochromogenes]